MSNIYSLFSVYGIEIEYMIVDKEQLDVNPITDQVLAKIAGQFATEVPCDKIMLTNELALHVIELNNNGPAPTLNKLDQIFHKEVIKLNSLLTQFNSKLMPSGTHPWMQPDKGIALWPHGDKTIYETYDRIFNCAGHGWGNLQSTHINLPFANDEEFNQLHNAIRIIMPLIPALCASTPFLEGKFTHNLDARLTYYASNQKSIPIISGDIIPEFISSAQEYQEKILAPMYQAVSLVDPDKVLQYEWLNSRGAIPRFDRSAIEIRIMDSQESPLTDISCVFAICALLQFIIKETDAYLNEPLSNQSLKLLYDAAIKQGLKTPVENKDFLKQFKLPVSKTYLMQDIWEVLLNQACDYIPSTYQSVLEKILSQGNLAERLVKANQKDPLKTIYQSLCACLAENKFFSAPY